MKPIENNLIIEKAEFINSDLKDKQSDFLYRIKSGEYEVYVIGKGATISTIEMQFATLTIIEDNTLIIVGVGVAVAAIVAIYTIRRLSNRRGVDG